MNQKPISDNDLQELYHEEKFLISFHVTNFPSYYTKKHLDELFGEFLHIIGCKLTGPGEAEVIFPGLIYSGSCLNICTFIENREVMKFPFFHLGKPMENTVTMQGDIIKFKVKKGFINKSKY